MNGTVGLTKEKTKFRLFRIMNKRPNNQLLSVCFCYLLFVCLFIFLPAAIQSHCIYGPFLSFRHWLLFHAAQLVRDSHTIWLQLKQHTAALRGNKATIGLIWTKQKRNKERSRGFWRRLFLLTFSFMKYSLLEGLRGEGNNNGPCDEFSVGQWMNCWPRSRPSKAQRSIKCCQHE